MIVKNQQALLIINFRLRNCNYAIRKMNEEIKKKKKKTAPKMKLDF